jgi:membrane protease YdiL (CAAX protease family)
MHDHEKLSPWKAFWDRGGWWKAVIAAAVYYGLYQGAGFALYPLLGSLWGEPGSVSYVLLTTALPILIGGIILVLFAWSIGWLRELFGPQPIRGRGWMWIAVAVVLVFNIARFISIDYGTSGFPIIATWLLAGLFIGFAEEFLTRGIAVTLLRRAGHREWVVAVVSSLIFAGLHIGNAFGGQAIGATAFQVVYTFAFGICMYLALRVTGTIIAPILLHASTDPSIFLLTTYPSASPLTPIAGVGNIPVIIVGLVCLIFIRGRVEARADASPPARSADTASVEE